MLLVVLQILWFFLPALSANLAPVFAARYNWWPQLDLPLDGGKTLSGRSILGSHKTLRGLIIGIIIGSIVGLIQYILQSQTLIAGISIITYPSALMAAAIGALIGFGALFGDAIKSFCKRRLNISPGTSWIPWDQIDVVVGVIIVTFWFAPLNFNQIIISLFVVGIGMYLSSVIGVYLKIKKSL
ncbi:MAG: CDP-archaeol synthase [Candidatus Andersenbacteria bacterium]|nr:CDP-archaeol synthase [bacterium]MDZ4225767.1 CDP-archaeol synthase [Candidatus Andersenbacteria bacterium]